MTLTLTKQEKILGWVYLLLQMLVLPFAVALVCVLMGITSDAVINGICFYLNAILALPLFRKLLKQSLRNAAEDWLATLRTALQGFGVYWLVNMVVNAAIAFLQPDFSNINDANVGTMISELPVMMTVAVILAAPLAEECLFRGWMFTGLAERSIPLAYVVTCGFFSAAHILGYIGTYDALTLGLCFLQYLGPSIALCWTCQKNDSLAAPLLLHMFINALGCVFLR